MNSVVVLLLAGVAVGCGGSAVTSPTAPASISPLTGSPFPPGATSGSNSVAGVILESCTRTQPMENGRCLVHPSISSRSRIFQRRSRYSDAQGKYLLCGLPDGAAAELSASMTTARVAYVSVPPHQPTMDIEIPPAR